AGRPRLPDEAAGGDAAGDHRLPAYPLDRDGRAGDRLPEAQPRARSAAAAPDREGCTIADQACGSGQGGDISVPATDRIAAERGRGRQEGKTMSRILIIDD